MLCFQKKSVSLQIEKNTQNTTAMDTTARIQDYKENTHPQKNTSNTIEPSIPDGYMSLEQFEDKLIEAVVKKAREESISGKTIVCNSPEEMQQYFDCL